MKCELSLKINIDSVIAFIFALSPFLQMYRVPGIGTNLEFTLVLCLGGLFAFYIFLKQRKYNVQTMIKTILICMFIYCCLNLLLITDRYIYRPSSTSFVAIFFYFLVLSVCMFVFKRERARQSYFSYVVKISVFMSFVVFIQTLLYYLIGTTITNNRAFLLPFQQFFDKSVVDYVETTGLVFGRLFRPSAFFLEPAHFSQYCSIGLICSLWKTKKLLNWRSILISMGMLATTSGLGLLCVILLWGLKIFVDGDALTQKRFIKIVVATFSLIVIFCALFVLSDSFQRSVLRIVIASDGYNSAIMGRLWSVVFLENLTGKDLVFGMGFHNRPTYGSDNIPYYMTGIVQLFYCEGLLGGFIFLCLYFSMMFKSYRLKELLPFYILVAYLPFLVGSSNLGMFTLIQYIPFLYVKKTS